MLKVYWSDTTGFKTLDRALAKLDGKHIARIGSMSLNDAGSKARTATKTALYKQVGLGAGTIGRFLRTTRASQARLRYQINGFGGDIALKYFSARETRKGVSARPFGQRRVFKGTFIKGGRFPARVALGMNGQVFARADSDRFPIKKQKSGVILPKEVVQGASADAWQSTVGKVLPRRVIHHLRRTTGKAFS
jgi:hypothetical protein